MGQPGLVLDVTGDFITALPGHPDVSQNDVGRLLLDTGDRLIAVADGHDPDVLIRERQLDDALDGDAIVGEKKSVRHLGSIGGNESTPQCRFAMVDHA